MYPGVLTKNAYYLHKDDMWRLSTLSFYLKQMWRVVGDLLIESCRFVDKKNLWTCFIASSLYEEKMLLHRFIYWWNYPLLCFTQYVWRFVESVTIKTFNYIVLYIFIDWWEMVKRWRRDRKRLGRVGEKWWRVEENSVPLIMDL